MPDQRIQDLIRQEAASAGVPPELALAVAEQESGFNPTVSGPTLPSGARAIGTFQLLPATAQGLGVDPNDPHQNIQGGVKYLRQLLDKHQGDLPSVLADYGGVVKDQSYVPGVMARVSKFKSAAPPAPPAPAPGTFAAEHPYLNSMVQGLDPNEQEGRRNIAGMIGGMAGGLAGGAIGAAGTYGVGTGVGASAGSAAGSFAGGALEDLIFEQTGLGERLGRLFPGQTDLPVESPDQTLTDRGLRAARVGATQGLYDVAGQAVFYPARLAAKRLLATPIGEAAGRAFDTAKTGALDRMAQALEGLRQVRENFGLSSQQALDAAHDVIRQRVGDVSTRGAAAITTAAADREAAIAAAQARADAALASSRTAHHQYLAEGAPSSIAAGTEVGQVFRGPATAARDVAGQAVTEAAATGPRRSIAAVQEEANRIAREELLPPAVVSQRRPAKGGPKPLRPKERQLLQQASAAELQRKINHPAMGVISAIANAPPEVDFATLHLWESQLRQSLQGSADKVTNSQVTNITRHLQGLLRGALAGEAPHVPFEEAAAAYGPTAQRLTKGLAPVVKRMATTEPEKIVQGLTVNDPSKARMLVEVLTEQAAQGEGKEAGAHALSAVQDAWLHENVVQGPLDQLGARVAQLEEHPEFVQAFLNTPDAKQLLDNYRQLGELFQATKTEGAARVGEATRAGDLAVEQAKQAAGAALTGERTAGARQLRGMRRAASAQKVQFAREYRGKVGEIAARKKGTPEEQAFLASGLNPKDRSPLSRKMEAIVRTLLFAHGVSAFDPRSLFIGALVKGGHNVSDEELVRYVAHSRWLTRAVVTGLHSQPAKAVQTVIGRTVLAGATTPPPQPPRSTTR